MCRGAFALLSLLLLAGCGGSARLEVVSDECPEDDSKIYPGECGCGVPEARCLPLKSTLVHRYAFDGTGPVAVDEISGADGQIINAELTGTGQLNLVRTGLEQYVELPNRIVSALGSATFEAWVVWDTPEADEFWERIFDFGVSTAGEDLRESGGTYIFLAPAKFRTAYKNLLSNGEIWIDAGHPFPQNAVTHVAVVVDEATQLMLLYLNAVEEGRVALAQPLSSIEDVNNWLARSQFARDTRFGGSFLEFRIYAAALSAQELESSVGFGDSPAFLREREPAPSAQVASGALP